MDTEMLQRALHPLVDVLAAELANRSSSSQEESYRAEALTDLLHLHDHLVKAGDSAAPALGVVNERICHLLAQLEVDNERDRKRAARAAEPAAGVADDDPPPEGAQRICFACHEPRSMFIVVGKTVLCAACAREAAERIAAVDEAVSECSDG